MRWRVTLLTLALVGVAGGAAGGEVEAPEGFGAACVDVATGADRWRTPVEPGRSARLRVVGGGLWIGRGPDPGAWERRDLATGRIDGTGEPPADAPAPPVDGIDERAFWTTTDAVLHERDGAARTVVTTGAFVDDLVVAGDVLVFTLDHDDGHVYGFGLAQGRLRWVLRPRDRVAGYEAGDGARVERLGDRVLVHAPPALLSIDPATGAPAWIARVPALAGRWGPLRAVVAGDAWIVAVDGVVVAVDVATGRVRWTVDAGDGGATTPVVASDAVCFDWRDEPVVPFARDEAEVARALRVTFAGACPTSDTGHRDERHDVRCRRSDAAADEAPDLTWVPRAEVPAGATRVPLVELPEAGEGGAGPRLELTGVAGTRVVDPARVVSAADRVVYVEVPGAWESARWIGDAPAP